MKAHQTKKTVKPEKIMVPLEGQEKVEINLEEIPNIEWNLLISALLPGIEGFYADSANRAAFEAEQAKGA